MKDFSLLAILEHQPISRFAKSKVAILCDITHSSTPCQEAAAGQVIDDARILAEVLVNRRIITHGDVTCAFQTYDAVRRERI